MDDPFHPGMLDDCKAPGKLIQEHVKGPWLHQEMPGIVLQLESTFALQEGFSQARN